MLSVLDPVRIATNTRALAAVAGGEDRSYFGALHRLQGRFPKTTPGAEGPRLVFDLDDPTKAFLSRVLAESQLPGLALKRLSPTFELDARAKVTEALRLLTAYHPEMPMSVRQIMSHLVFAEVTGCAGGSSIEALGVVWVSPSPAWTAARYAECLCHELVHQALFLEDMLAPIFEGTDDETLIVSSIRRCERPYESSFHAAAVAAALIELNLALGTPLGADELRPGLAESVAAFEAMPRHLTTRGREILAELGRIVSSARAALGAPTAGALA